MALMTFQKKISWKQIHCPCFFFLFIFFFISFSCSPPFSFLSLYIFSGRPRLEWPRLAGKLFSWEGRGGRRGGATTQVKTYSRVCEAQASHAWPTAVLVSDRSHESRLDGGRMLSTVLECIGAAGGAGICRHSPAPLATSGPREGALSLSLSLSLVPLFPKSQMKDKCDFFFSSWIFFPLFFQARFRSWGCCNSRTFSWLLDLGTEQTQQKERLGFALLMQEERIKRIRRREICVELWQKKKLQINNSYKEKDKTKKTKQTSSGFVNS